jgi:hypothetical protein
MENNRVEVQQHARSQKRAAYDEETQEGQGMNPE